MKRLVIILAFLLCVIRLSAQTVFIAGTVNDETGEPVVGCSIYTSESRSTYTDSLGHYSIPVSQNITVEIHYECIGYKVVVMTFSPESEASFNPDVKMEEDLFEVPFELDEKPDKCIKCDGKVLPILYGLPSKEGMKAIERGEYVWGGDVGDGRYNCFACTSCWQLYHVKEKQFFTVSKASIPNEVEFIKLYTVADKRDSLSGIVEILYPYNILFEDKMGKSICQDQENRVFYSIRRHPVELIRFEEFELVSVGNITLHDNGERETMVYCFKREVSKTQDN